VQQQKHEFEVEYRFDPSPDAADRLDRALDIILGLILADPEKNPSNDGNADLAEGVQ
jgi:hypothetical protein